MSSFKLKSLQQSKIACCKLKILSPSNASLNEVLGFSKLTGDFVSLSTTDIKKLSLIFDLEIKYLVSKHLKLKQQHLINFQLKTQLDGKNKAKEDLKENKANEDLKENETT